MNLDVKNLGQVFTPENLVQYMVSLIANKGAILEPSCGDGAFLKMLPLDRTTAIEKQSELCKYKHLNIDFFDFKTTGNIKTIIGNPPYVRQQDILSETKEKLNYSLFDKRSNLYLFFIDKSIDLLGEDGEIIFITPRNFLKQTSSRKLNEKLFELGSFTHFVDFGDRLIFSGFSPNCAIWRWQKGLKSKRLNDGRNISCINGQIIFNEVKNDNFLKNIFDIKVGAVSGADHIFKASPGKKNAIDFVCSSTNADGNLKRMIYNTYDDCLLQYKDTLIKRQIRQFNEHNWWEWGRKYHHRTEKRIYVNCKTRKENPFFLSDVISYDGSVLALMPKSHKTNLVSFCDRLNSMDWEALGFKCGGRYIFSQKSLENIFV